MSEHDTTSETADATAPADADGPIDTSWTLPERDDELAALLERPVEADTDGELGPGSVMSGTIQAVNDDVIAVDLGDGLQGFADADEARLPGIDRTFNEGDTVTVMLEGLRSDGRWNVSLGKGWYLQRFEELKTLGNSDQTVEGTIRYVVRGGFAVDAAGIRAFLPGRESGVHRNQAWDARGESHTFRVIRFDTDRGELVLSRRAEAEAERKAQVAEAYDALEVGSIVEGRVSSIKPFGAFVDLGGVDGLIHVSELSAGHVADPSEALRVGDTVRVKIVEVDRDRERIALSRREVELEAVGEQIAELQAGTVLEGTVRRLADFGAFIEIAEGVEGLCHVSELSWTERPKHPSDVVAVGDTVSVKILEVNAETRRVSLSIKQTADNPWSRVADAHPPGSDATGTITRIEDYGLFVRIEDGVEGLCHISDLTWEGRPERPSDVGEFAVGDEITVRVLEVDTGRQRISLGVKQLSGDPWDDAGDRTTVGTVFEATVTRTEENAAWLEVAPGLEGRMHISEISTERVDSVRSALRIGQQVEVMTVTADRQRRRIDLSIKAIELKLQEEMPRHFEDDDTGMNPLAAAFAKRSESDAEPASDDDAT